MPENPNIDPDMGSESYYNANVTMATNNNNNNRKQGIPRVSSANNTQYYDIATQLLGKAGSDLEELFIAAARDGLYDKIENFLHRNRSDYVVSIDVKDKKTGNTPLIWAAKRGHAKIVQLLLKHGADITLRNYEGQTAVEVASPTIKSILLESVERSTEASHQLLLQAAWQGDNKVVARLLSQKKVLDINCQNADGYTPILLATRDMHLFEKISSQMSREYNPIEVVSMLLSARADLHATDGDGKTCLHHASQSKAQLAQTVVSTIISGEPNLEQKDKRCFAPLHCASLTGNADCLSALLDGGSEVNSRGFAGATALHITSYNNHEKATSVLLEHGANVTLTDDRGLTPLDFAKTRKMKRRLQEAWTEVVNNKPSPSLAPIRAHSKEDLRTSVEDLTKRKKGEVIFEGLPSNPFSDSGKKDSIANPRGITRHLSLKEKSSSRFEEDHTSLNLRDNVRKLGQVRGQQKPSPLPRTKSRSTERLPIISPDRMGSDRNLESPVNFGRNSRARRSFEDRKQGRGRRVAPLSTREGSNLTDDVFDRQTSGPPSPTFTAHRRSESDPFKNNTNLLDIAASCDPYLHAGKRGRSYSVNSNPANDLEANRFTPHQREVTVTSLQRDITLMSVCSNRTESRLSTNSTSPRILNLGQMLSKSKTPVQHMYGPSSNKVIPPTPTFITQTSDSKSEMDVSPRSDDDIESRPELIRSKSIYKDEFILEESRPKDPRLSSSGSDTVSSTGSSHTSPSPRDSPLPNKAKVVGNTKTGKGRVNKTNTGAGNNVKQVNKHDSKQELKVTGFNSRENSNVSNSVPKPKGGNSNVSGNSKYVTALHNMAVRNLAAQNASKQTNNAIGGVKKGGTIVMHGTGIEGINETVNKKESCENDSKDSNGNIVEKETQSVGKETQSVGKETQSVENKGNDYSSNVSEADVKNNVTTKTSGIDKATVSKTIGQPAVNSKKMAAQKQMKNVLQVVPTKLTENILRTAPKGKTVEDKKKNVVSKGNENVCKTPKPDSVSNVNIQLSPSAQVQSRVAVSEKAKTPTEVNVHKGNSETKDTDSVKVNAPQPQTTKTNDNPAIVTKSKSTVSSSSSSIQSSSQTKGVVNQVKSAQVNNREGAQSRNTTFNSSKSASVNQRQMGNVRKTSSSYTPRFQSNLTAKISNLGTKTENKTVGEVNGANNDTNADKIMVDSEIKTNEDIKKSDISAAVKAAKSSSPTELVTPSVNRTSSMSKSYNMGGPQPLVKSSSSGSVTSEISTTVSKSTFSDKSDKNLKKHSVVCKSVSEPLSSTKVSSPNLMSKSIAQMPCVGTVSNDKKQNNGIPRSSSMSTFEEKNEKKLMSSSDTKIECIKATTKDRPMSDGPAGVASVNKNPPLVEILPECAPRLSKRSYMDINNPVTTPVIVNPFEELEQKRALTATDIGFIVEKPSVERSKTQTSIKSKNSKSSRKAPSSAKPSSASTRGTSGRSKKSVKTKDSNKSDNEGSRPKTGKRVKSGKRKRKVPEPNLSKQNEQPDVALIGGIGWQIATSCIDKSEADAVIVSQIDSSESDGEDISVISHLRIPSPDSNMQLLGNLDTPSSIYSPRFKEVRPTNGETRDEDLAFMENDGYRPMNLDMTQGSSTQQNRAGVILTQDMPGDIGDFLSKLKEDDSALISDVNDEYIYDDDIFGNDMYDDEDIENLLHKGVIMGQLTPIPESPSITRTPSSIQHVAKTVEAITKFDRNINDHDLKKLLDSTPREKTKGNKSTPRNSGGSVRTQKDTKQSLPNSGVTRSVQSRNSSSKTTGSRVSSLSAEIKERANRVFGNHQFQSQPGSATSVMESNSIRKSSEKNSSFNSLRKHSSKEKLNTSIGKDEPSENIDYDVNSLSLKQGDANCETKERIDTKVSDLKKLLSEKMQTTQKMLEESADRKRKQSVDKFDDNSDPGDLRINLKGLTVENVQALETARLEEDAKSTRSSRKERKFSETKKTDEDDEETKEAINEILSTTIPSNKSNMKSFDSYRSKGSSTLTEADASVFKQMIQQNHQNSPFYAKEPSVRISSSYDDSVTLNKDNPELMKRFHANNFQMGQKVKAMIDAGADSSRVKAMVKVDNEAKQLAKIMNSFKQMELYAGPHSNNRSSKKETPRRDGDNVVKSMSKFDHPHHNSNSGMPPRPGSAGAGKVKHGKFTEIKGKSASHVTPRSRSPVDVPKDLADEFKRSPFKQVSTNQEENIDELANVIRITSQDSEEDHLSLDYNDDEMERADSACTTLSSHSSLMEETIQWKKGNVLGKGAFGTVWCGLTSEGQLIAVKQIELNTTNQNKAKKEYEKVQEEVELLKTLEHKNIVGYMGTSLEDSIVSIFMQFVPGGSIASILARFGALDEAVFRKYTRQILEGVVYLHQNDVIHRDIKGGNVMLMPNGVIKLIDFGCAKRLCINLSMGQSQILKSMKGTPYWMAPEVVNETGHGKKSDIWSVGCTVFEMATRKPPWADMNPMAAIFAIGSDKPVPQLPEKFSEDAKEFVNACLTKDQNTRLSASELLQSPFLKKRSKKNSSTC